jgi:hypothetical protein
MRCLVVEVEKFSLVRVSRKNGSLDTTINQQTAFLRLTINVRHDTAFGRCQISMRNQQPFLAQQTTPTYDVLPLRASPSTNDTLPAWTRAQNTRPLTPWLRWVKLYLRRQPVRRKDLGPSRTRSQGGILDETTPILVPLDSVRTRKRCEHTVREWTNA